VYCASYIGCGSSRTGLGETSFGSGRVEVTFGWTQIIRIIKVTKGYGK
jgi:hypothetical protein